ncbi:MAG: hypothetical protein H7256_06095 [Bdellovibrio sp.]|nr:hypothetical protein [Bdellovibrio sp.]
MTINDQVEILELLSQLSKTFNSYYEVNYKLRDLIDQKVHALTITNQFLPVTLNFPEASSAVARWMVDENVFQTQSFLKSFKRLGQNSHLQTFDFYLPVDFFSLFPELIASLGSPQEICKGHLTSSGRSIWVFPKKQVPLCLKVDTYDFVLPKKYNSRINRVAQIDHSLKMSQYLQDEDNIFSENDGLTLTFDTFIEDKVPKTYSYLVRTLDFKKCNVERKDLILPMQTVVATDFWNDLELRKYLKLQDRTVVDFFMNDVAKAFAELLRNALTKSFVHFELHQQNLSVVVRNGRGVKLLYHDLLDSVFDPIGYFLNHLHVGCKNASKLLQKIADIDATTFFNCHGTLETNKKRKLFTVVSIYRRYIRNFGDYTKIFNMFSGEDYCLSLKFETCILKYLSFSDAELGLSNQKIDNQDFLTQQLFWSIDAFHRTQQHQLLQRSFAQLLELATPQSDSDMVRTLFEDLIFRETCFVSCHFPISLDFYVSKKLQSIHSLWNHRVFIGTYDSQMFIIIFAK